MKTGTMNGPRRLGALTVVLGLLCAQAVQAAPYVILRNGKRVVGTRIRVRSNGNVVLTTGAGSRTFTAAQVRQAVSDPPSGFDVLRRQVEKGDFDAAIPKLVTIAKDYRMLEWDNQARRLLVIAYMGKKQYRKAAETCEALIKSVPGDWKPLPEIKASYREALLHSKQYSKLTPMLDETIAKGDRTEAAFAQIMRGDIYVGMKDLDHAVLDYLRTVLLFEQVAEAQPEALFKAAECLEKMRDNRAKDLYKRIVSDYSESEYGAKAKAKLSQF